MNGRPATATDAPRIAAIHVTTWRIAYRGPVPDDFLDGLSVEHRTSAWRDIVADTAWPWKGVLIAEDGSGELVAFAHVCSNRDDDAGPDVGEATAIYIAPEAWQQGAGRALLDRGHHGAQGLEAIGLLSRTEVPVVGGPIDLVA